MAEPNTPSSLDHLLLVIALGCVAFVVLKGSLREIKTLAFGVPPEVQEAADNWNAFKKQEKERLEQIRRRTDPSSPEYVEPYKEEKTWPLLTKDNEPEDGQCIQIYFGDGSLLVTYKRATETKPALLTGEGPDIVVNWDWEAHWKPCPTYQ